MTGLFFDIEPYFEDPVEWEVERVLKILSVGEDYDFYSSVMNHCTDRQHRIARE